MRDARHCLAIYVECQSNCTLYTDHRWLPDYKLCLFCSKIGSVSCYKMSRSFGSAVYQTTYRQTPSALSYHNFDKWTLWLDNSDGLSLYHSSYMQLSLLGGILANTIVLGLVKPCDYLRFVVRHSIWLYRLLRGSPYPRCSRSQHALLWSELSIWLLWS